MKPKLVYRDGHWVGQYGKTLYGLITGQWNPETRVYDTRMVTDLPDAIYITLKRLVKPHPDGYRNWEA
jgi:hypothetical protein